MLFWMQSDATLQCAFRWWFLESSIKLIASSSRTAIMILLPLELQLSCTAGQLRVLDESCRLVYQLCTVQFSTVHLMRVVAHRGWVPRSWPVHHDGQEEPVRTGGRAASSANSPPTFPRQRGSARVRRTTSWNVDGSNCARKPSTVCSIAIKWT